MLAPPCRLYCLLKRAQMLLLGLGIAYLMAGSILLLQRSSIRVTQPNLASLPPLLSLAAPPTALRTAGLGVRTRIQMGLRSAPVRRGGQGQQTLACVPAPGVPTLASALVPQSAAREPGAESPSAQQT
ncbi:WSC domain containing protein 1 [Dissostichus eleginoides]|uniref:WSC domain containing protein 1 n=1 Tax=Dissostichus eleginoides TaxID=100907 RepID=A0AAD9BFD4_DISEL|nr:WSC domain containing protein 1 [Dissostichus eleginoides]